MTTDWTLAELGDYFKIKHGYAFKSKYFSNDGDYIVLTPGNFLPHGGLSLKGEKEKYYLGDFPQEYILTIGDLLIVMTDLTQNAPILGAPAFIKQNNKFLHNQRLGLVQDLDEEQLYKPYLFFLMNAPEVKGQLKGSATGATVKHTAPERIYRVKVPIPPLPTQHKIAGILSAYDDLIENNIRHIKILEEMAQRIYKEWFVDFRYPGHENAKMVESELGLIPEGWEVNKLGEMIELTYGKGLKKADRHGGSIPVYGSGGIVGNHNKALVPGPGIIVGRKGNVGSVYWSQVDFFPIDTVFYVVSDIPLHYLYYNLQYQNFINTDAAVPGLSRNLAHLNDILIPKSELIAQFQEHIEIIFGQIKSLSDKNENLRQTRDLLLPKLISGKVDVSKLKIRN